MTHTKKSGAGATQARGDAFVQAVLQVALEQLAQVGFDRFSIPEVAALAGANKTSVYRRWPTKEDLVKDALRAAMGHAEEAVGCGSLRDDLIGLARTLAEFLESSAGRSVMRILLNDGDNAELRAIAISAYGDVSRRAAWIAMDEAVRRGELKTKVEPSTVLFTLAGALIHRVLVEKAGASEAFVEGVVDIVLSGVAVQGSSPDE
jgi:AcrR family transcriptional regulator